MTVKQRTGDELKEISYGPVKGTIPEFTWRD
jgi:hypothetical protein